MLGFGALGAVPLGIGPTGAVYSVAITEAGSAADSASATASLGAVVAEVAVAADQTSATGTFGVTIAEAGTAVETVNDSGAIYQAGIVEAAASVDAVTTTSTYGVGVTESVTPVDTVGGGGTYSAAVTEQANATDLTDASPPTPKPPAPALAVPPTTLQNAIRSYLYVQYNDDENLQGFVAAYNEYVQAYVDWFNTINLPVYTNGSIAGALLDWVGTGLYGYPRPGLPTTGTSALGPFNTWAFNTLEFNQQTPAVSQTFYATTDDIYKRVLTWLFFKGDGHQINVRWLKRRVERFLYGINGINFNVDQTYDVSVTFTGPHAVTIHVPNSAQKVILSAAIAAGILELPFQITWTVT